MTDGSNIGLRDPRMRSACYDGRVIKGYSGLYLCVKCVVHTTLTRPQTCYRKPLAFISQSVSIGHNTAFFE
jgi:hypothetical protein